MAMGLVAGIMSCSTPRVSFDYLLPAEVNLPISVQRLVVVDHSAPQDEKWDIAEGLLTGEGVGQDREGVLNLIAGIKEIGLQSNRYELLREDQRYGKGKLIENIPDPMEMTLIRSIGKKHGADAVLAIDKFDSDFIVTTARKDDKKDPKDTTKVIAQYEARGVATVKAYIRVYDVSTGHILDEIKHSDEFVWTAVATTAAQAILQLMSKQKAVNDVSYRAGLAYGRRIAPASVQVTRTFYKGPKNKYAAFDSGVRRAEVGDWYGAMKDFENTVLVADPKMQGKAAYNLAICLEVLNRLEEAQGWAQDAYVKYGLSHAKEYQAILQQRIYDRDELLLQMEKPGK